MSPSPAPGTPVQRLRLAFASCQNYEVGRYAAWDHVVADDPDLVLFLGDYIYERALDPTSLRPYLNPEPIDLAGYRASYASYKLDPRFRPYMQPCPGGRRGTTTRCRTVTPALGTSVMMTPSGSCVGVPPTTKPVGNICRFAAPPIPRGQTRVSTARSTGLASRK